MSNSHCLHTVANEHSTSWKPRVVSLSVNWLRTETPLLFSKTARIVHAILQAPSKCCSKCINTTNYLPVSLWKDAPIGLTLDKLPIKDKSEISLITDKGNKYRKGVLSKIQLDETVICSKIFFFLVSNVKNNLAQICFLC